MIYEMARLRIDPAQAEQFEAAVESCVDLFRSAPGCRSMLLERQLEDDAEYVLRVGWNTVEDHMETFRRSAAFGKWRRIVGGFFTAPPVVVHHRPAMQGF